MSKPRNEVVAECANQVAACWNHYSDRPLTSDKQVEIEQALDKLLPNKISTKHWQQYADEYNRRVAAE